MLVAKQAFRFLFNGLITDATVTSGREAFVSERSTEEVAFRVSWVWGRPSASTGCGSRIGSIGGGSLPHQKLVSRLSV